MKRFLVTSAKPLPRVLGLPVRLRRLPLSSSIIAPSRIHATYSTQSGKDIFQRVHEKIPAFAAPATETETETDPVPVKPVHSFNSVVTAVNASPADLLPPAQVLDLLHTEGRITVKSDVVYAVVASVQSAWSTLDDSQSQKDLTERILKLCTLKDLTYIATITFEHTDNGKPLGFLMLQLAKDAGDMNAEFKYAHALSRGFPPFQPRDLPQALEILQSLVKRRHALSMYVLALRLIKQGTNPAVDVAKSPIESAETASAAPTEEEQQQQSTPTNSKIDEKMIAQGLRHLYVCATELSYPQALIQMGHLYLNGILVQKDAKKAYELLERAAEKDVTEAMFLCGTCWEKGEGVETVDLNKALEWWIKAANRGLAIAQHNVASAYLEGTATISKSIPLALEYFEMAAMQNLPLSLMNLAKLYREGYLSKSGEPRSWKIDANTQKSREYATRVVDLGGEWADIGKEFLDSLEAELKEKSAKGEKAPVKKSWWQ
ncbi:HCP-like protein [Rhizoclosmatium globosum]|uniref:HCP-like protein n=1 Tax=Rhizoclosmatium globosum TaxID=329046 RepID=A0A1Y2CD08_9FUNG|nr:HCP-like protein [Rhizoclosmatium globosum]|eukprot:ORY44704.1 HCP-like protein [Rhizoclosmatium globosum]